LEQGQVHIMGANAASAEPEKTIVLVNLVPTWRKVWQQHIIINLWEVLAQANFY